MYLCIPANLRLPKRLRFVLEHIDSQHASFYLNKEVTLRFPKHIVALLEAFYIDPLVVIRWNGRHSSELKTERGMIQCCILSPPFFNNYLYTESVKRDTEIEELGIKTGGESRFIF